MTELLTAAQMRAIEQAAIASGEVTGLELMERAGRGVVEAIFEEWPELQATSHRAVVLCGPGNNGGDGFVVARLLKEWGWEVEVFLYGDPEKLPPDAKVNCERWRGMGEVRGSSEISHEVFTEAAIAVDALFGIGLSRPVSFEIAGALHFAHATERSYPRKPEIVAIDVLSGFDADSGKALGPLPDLFPDEFIPPLTVTFERAKLGHHLSRHAELGWGAGSLPPAKIRVKSLGLDSYVRDADDSQLVDLIDGDFGWMKLDIGKFNSGSHKYTHGHALILSGPPGRTGAARLAARGALRIGAGLVTVGAAPGAIPEHAARLDAVMLRPLADAEALAEVLQDRRITALCLGPGLGLDERARDLVRAALASPSHPSPTGEGRHPAAGGALPLSGSERGEGRGSCPATVLDADALTILSQNPGLFAALHDRCVLAPHAGEFAHLFPDIAEKLAAPATKGPAYSKVDATREAAKRAGCVILFKGPDTVIADPSGRCSINSAHYDRAAPWLATAGSGDVLSGFIAGLLARGFAPMQAAETAAWLHVECARKFGPGLIAEDLPEQLPAVFRDLGL